MGLGKTVEVIALILAHKSAMTIAPTIPSRTIRPQNATEKLESQQYLTETNGIDDGSWRYSCVCGEPELAGFGVEDGWVRVMCAAVAAQAMRGLCLGGGSKWRTLSMCMVRC